MTHRMWPTVSRSCSKLWARNSSRVQWRAGLAACAEFEPQFIFLDLGMPEMATSKPRAACAKSRWKEGNCNRLDGWGGQEIKQEVEKTGFDRHLVSLSISKRSNASLFPQRRAWSIRFVQVCLTAKRTVLAIKKLSHL